MAPRFFRKCIWLVTAVLAGLCFFCVPSISRAECGPVILDPGHGGSDSGACGNGLVEKVLTSKITAYCQERLTELGIPTVLTRDGDYDVALAARCQYAGDYNARALVSFHINSASGTSGTGAEVWIANESSYNYFTHTEGLAFGTDLLARLEGLGLVNRHCKTGSMNSAAYPDGTKQDYLAINRLARLQGTTGVLIEHGFINNPTDAALLANEDYLRAWGYADADAIAQQWPNSYTKPAPDPIYPEGWMKNDNGWWYQYSDGSYPRGGWASISGTWYHFDDAGYMHTGWLLDNGVWYWLGYPDDGSMKTGWTNIGGTWYWMWDSGAMAANTWLALDAWYHLDATGAMNVGWYSDGATWYWLGGDGRMAAGGWINVGGAWYWLWDNGAMAANTWLALDAWYHLDATGAMNVGWYYDGATWYWLGGDGRMAAGGWVNVGGAWYWLWDNGAMAANTWLALDAWYHLDATGAAHTGWYFDGTTWYLMDGNARMLTGWQWVGNNYYFLADSGAMLTGWILWGNDWYWLDSTTGAMQTGWLDAAGNHVTSANPESRVYYLDASGKLIYTRSTLTPVMTAANIDLATFAENFSAKIAANYPAVYAEKGAPTPQDFAVATWNAAASEGVNPAVLAAQIGVETGWLKFGGAVPADACNFGGIGAVDSAPQNYAVFSSVQEGLLAQAQHLKAYACTAPLNQACVDPRFNLVTRGIAPYVENFGAGIWASDQIYCVKLLQAMSMIGA